jgi:acyl carrier protein
LKPTTPLPSSQVIAARIQKYVAEALGVPPELVDPDRDVGALGLTSVSLVGLLGELEEWLDIEISPAVLYDHPTINKVAFHIAEAGTER